MHYVAIHSSYGSAHKVINKALNRTDEIELALSTYGDFERREAASMSSRVEQEARKVLADIGFDYDTGQLVEPELFAEACKQSASKVPPADFGTIDRLYRSIADFMQQNAKSGARFNLDKLSPDDHALNDNTVYIAFDDVLSKMQKETRLAASPVSDSCWNEEAELENRDKRAFVSNNCLRIDAPGLASYFITAPTAEVALKHALAYLGANYLLDGYYLVFLTDGAKSLHKAIEAQFKHFKYRLILDWHHIVKNCVQFISQSISGTLVEKRGLRNKIVGLLWHCDIACVLNLLAAIKDQDDQLLLTLLYPAESNADSLNKPEQRFIPRVKNAKKLEEFIGYITRKEHLMACYSFRSYLGLKISSNMAEKANDLLVAQRQKHNGMSWSQSGSSGLATITCFQRNNDLDKWISQRDFSFAAKSIDCPNDPTSSELAA